MGAVFGVSPRWDCQSVGRSNGIVATVWADLCNVAGLMEEIKAASNHEPASVAELVAALYGCYGLGALEKLAGSFAIAIWDIDRQEAILAVDPLGLESLYWADDRGRLLFSSRVGGIAQSKADCHLDPAAMMQYLLHTVVPAPMTIYRGVERLEAGTALVWRRGVATKNRYWDLQYQESTDNRQEFWADQLRQEMRQAVHSHLSDCRPEQTGGYLSGGTDSSSIVAFASELHNSFNTFSIYFENPRYDELAFARIAASRFRANQHEACLTADDAARAIPAIVDYYDEPFGNPSAIGSYHCARLAQQHGVDILLAGDGGDELFAGNERYASDKKFALYQSLPGVVRNGMIKPFSRMLPSTGALSLPGRFIRRAELPNPHRMFSYSFFLSHPAEGVFEQSFLDQVGRRSLLDVASSHFNRAPEGTSELNRLLYLDVKMTLADNDIRKVRGTAELAGVRVRFPLLDRRLAEFSGRIPSKLKLKGFEKRFIFKKAMSGILPKEILHKRKHGFGVPVGYWAMHHGEMRALAAILDEPQTRQRGYFRPAFLDELKQLNQSHPAYYGDILWTLIMLELWHRRHNAVTPMDDRMELGAVHVS
jgi:asparagine synthase (glutamine-hydrolysing)